MQKGGVRPTIRVFHKGFLSYYLQMKVLMFGWEFPPNISGGLGTACYGLTKGLSMLKNMEVTFVVPKLFGGEDKSKIHLIDAGDVSIAPHRINLTQSTNSLQYIEVNSGIVPYTDPKVYANQSEQMDVENEEDLFTDSRGRVHFTGKYTSDLLSEIVRYAMVAKVIAKENEFDIIHAHDWLTYPSGIAAKEVSGKPLVIHVHATDFDRSGGSVNPEVYAIEKQGMEKADKIITVSNLTKKIVVEKYGIDPQKIETVYNAVEPVKRETIKPFQKGFNEKVVTFLGRITTQKGPQYFVEAANRVLKRMNNVRFVMAGSGDMMEQMIMRAAQLGICDRFYFTGFLKGEEVNKMLKLSDVYIMPSVSEPFGISPLEAMEAGVPTIISNQSGVAEILSNAIKINFWDVDAIADSIYAILNHPKLSKIMSKKGRKEVFNLKWENAAIEVNNIYKSAIYQLNTNHNLIALK